MARVTALRSIELGVTDLRLSITFYRECWGLRPVAEGPGFCYLRATGPDHHVLALRERQAPMLIRIDFAAASPGAVQKLHGELKSGGVTIRTEPGPVQDPGGGYGFDFADPAGREFRIVSDAAIHADAADLPDRPRKLSHVVLNSTDADADAAFFQDVLDSRLSDQTAMMEFLRCNADHHSIAFVRAGSVSLNHAAFEMPDWDAVMRGAGRMKEAGHALEWGIGRHGPGNNVFAYFIEPDGMVVEYTAELQRIDEVLHRPGNPQVWDRPLNRLDQWGFAGSPSEKILNAMNGAGQA
jgi:catechol 2,3-dioxygenase-like lactoylglutathione lyase family enzyme